MKPPFTYYGGKVGMSHRIVDMLPEHRVYMEPFFGSGAVLFAKPPAPNEIINDLDGAIVNFFTVLRDRIDELERVCALTPYARDEYDAANLDDPFLDPVERARRFWVRVNQSFAKTAGTNTGWSITTARSQSPPNSVLGRLGRFADCADRLRRVTIENRDAADLVEKLATDDTVVYLDPPYAHEARSNRHAGSGGDYRVDMLGAEAHRRLAEVLHATPATVLLSGYPTPLYEDLYGDWPYVDVEVVAASSNARRNVRSGRVERLWSNRAIAMAPTQLELAP